MNKFLDSMVLEDNEQGLTQNGAKTNKSSLNACLDLFFNIGASRNKNIIPLFHKAYLEDRITALKIALWARDCRGGAGERQVFIDISRWLAENGHEDDAQIPFIKIPELGRWDDMLKAFHGTVVWHFVVNRISNEIKNGNGLMAKWAPRKGPIAHDLRIGLRMTPKQYRKTIVNLSKTVEQQMCAKQWDAIKYDSVPSVAFARYMHAFNTHDNNRFQGFLEDVKQGKKTINASVVFPHDVIRALREREVADAQWKSLPNYLEGNNENILVMADVSGSMGIPVSGSVTALNVCISLALYISERMEGEFKDCFLTFSAQPELQRLSGSLFDRYTTLKNAHWGLNTNLQSAFDTILDTAVKRSVPKKDMPTTILILSDMEFDQASSSNYGWNQLVPAINFDAIEAKYKGAGYKMPKIVFWKLNNISTGGNVPVIGSKKNVSLISGFSPSILTNVLKHGNLDPLEMMHEVLASPRYQF